MRYVIAFTILVVTAASGELLQLWDSRTTNAPPASEYRPVDVANRKHPDWEIGMMKCMPPCLYDTEVKMGAATLDGLEAERTNTFTAAQRQGHKELRDLKQLMGLPKRTSDIKLLSALIENCRTNSSNVATRRLLTGTAAYIIQESRKGDSDER